MRNLRACILPILVAAALPAFIARAAEPAVDYDAEINRLRKELSQTQDERQRNRQEMEKDKKDFKAYVERTTARFDKVRHETDSLKKLISVNNMKKDSLAAQVGVAEAIQRQVDINQGVLRDALVLACDSINARALAFPPMVSQALLASITLIRSELKGKTVDNIEAINRMFQIIQQMEEATSSIQVSQESSPVSEVRGTVYRIRLGAFFEALADIKGEKCAIWLGNDAAGNPQWQTSDDVTLAGQILKAANVREGKVLPTLVTLPLARDGQKGGAQ